MRAIRIEKVTLNVGCGDDKEKIERAKGLLELLTEQKPVITLSKRRSTFGVAKGKPIGVKVTLRKRKAEEFFKKVLQSTDNKIKSSQLDADGNMNIGIREYIDLPGVRYQHSIGMLGFNVCVTLERPGYRIKRRRIQYRRIPASHRITKEDASNWLKEKFDVTLLNE